MDIPHPSLGEPSGCHLSVTESHIIPVMFEWLEHMGITQDSKGWGGDAAYE